MTSKGVSKQLTDNKEAPKMDINVLKQYIKEHHEAPQYINWDADIQVLMSGGGYYIGMLDPTDGAPMCRLSTKYWASHEEAQQALDAGNFELKLWP